MWKGLRLGGKFFFMFKIKYHRDTTAVGLPADASGKGRGYHCLVLLFFLCEQNRGGGEAGGYGVGDAGVSDGGPVP